MGFPGGAAVKDPPANAGDARGTGLTLAREDPLEKEMAASPVLLSGKSHRPRSLAGYSPWGHKESDTTECTHTHTHTHTLSKDWTRAVRPVSHFIHMNRSPRSPSPGLTFTLCAPWSLVICLRLKCVRIALLVLLTLAALEHFWHPQHITALV